MKDFLKYTLATICGIVLVSVVGFLLIIISVVGMVAGESGSKVDVADNSVLTLRMTGFVSDRATEADPFTEFFAGADVQEFGLDDLTTAIRAAKDDKRIKGIYLEMGPLGFDGYAEAEALRRELEQFKESGKWVVAYANQYYQMGYYVASVADKLYMAPTGMIDLHGLGGMYEYDKGLYDKLGIKFQVAKVGKYKSAVEGYIRTGMSDEDREQRMAYFTGVWNVMAKAMAKSRKTSVEALDQQINDSILLFASTADYQKAKLVDGLMYPSQLKKEIKKRLELKDDDDIPQVTLDEMLAAAPKKDNDGDKVAIYYAAGTIVDEMPQGGLFGSGQYIVGNETAKDLQALADDDDIKAVVIRVNSPGGSAVASENIWHAIEELKAKKPVVVSMGGVAASGGYMMSCNADYIVAEQTTITGSIGIFGVIPNLSGLITDKLGVNFDGATTHKYTAFDHNLTLGKDNAQEMGFMQNYVDRGYDRFLTIVSEGRKMSKEQVNEVAQGRVWLATDALGIKLVDKLGSLDDAVEKAAELAKLEKHHAVNYPEPKSWFEQLMDSQSEDKDSYLDTQLRTVLGDETVDQLRLINELRNQSRLQARLPFSVRVR